MKTIEQYWLCIDINDFTPSEELLKIQSLLAEKQEEIKQTLFNRKENIAKQWEAKSKHFKQAITNVMVRTLDANTDLLDDSYLDYKDIIHWINSNVKALDKLSEIVPLGRLQDGIHEGSVKRAKLKLRKELSGLFYISYHYCFNESIILILIKESAFQHAGLCTQAVLDEVNLLIENDTTKLKE